MENMIITSRSALFSPVAIAGLNLKNRFVMAPMTRMMAPNGVVGPETPNYYRSRVEGGANLVITEGTLIDHPVAGHDTHLPHFYGESALAGWRSVVCAVHDAGGKILPQIWHTGLMRTPRPNARDRMPYPDEPSVSPSGFDTQPYSWARALRHDEIEQVIRAYVESASNAKSIGCDGVELHGAHGYLIDQFLRADTNRRTDFWGGSSAKRTRFAVEIIKGIRGEVGPEFPIVFRFSQWTLRDYHHRLAADPAELEEILIPLANAGVDIFHASTRRFWDPAFEGSSQGLAGWTRRITGLPVIAVGSVGLMPDAKREHLLDDLPVGGSLERLEAAFDEEEFDLICVGRAILANPDWPNRVRRGDREGFEPWTASTLSKAVVQSKT
jgi:2,4-dienoyl-CoA reductase-like NADH-dependent reductase (Old Yellow Enzyme family)